MAYLKDKLRRARFRGVYFEVEDSDIGVGRRVQVHEYPQRDTPYVEDIGRAARRFEISGFVIGPDYVDQANRLLDAIETAGPGELIHPWLGSMKVTVAEVSRFKFDSGLGKASFQLSVIEAGELVFPGSSNATFKIVRNRAATLAEKASAAFSSAFKVLGYVNRVASSALSMYGKALSVLANPIGTVTGMLGYGSLLGNLTSIYGLFASPPSLALNYSSLLNLSGRISDGSLVGSAATPQAVDRRLLPAARGLLSLSSSADLAPAAAPKNPTVAEQQEWVNDEAIKAHTRALLLVQAAGISSYLQCAIYDDVIALRNLLVRQLDAEMLLAADDELYQSMADLRSSVWQDLTERSRDSARLVTLTPPIALPALAIAYDYYEDASRDADLISRNAIIRHPGFVPPVALQVLSR